MQTLLPGDKRQLVQEARRIGLDLMPPECREDPTGGCLFFGLGFVLASTRLLGPGFQLQAGSASFKRVPNELDDGVSPDYFSYKFDPGQAVKAFVMRELPEMHVWCGNPKTRELVDVTTGYQKDQCEKLTGMDWLMPDPPPFVWDFTFNLERQRDLVYQPDIQAIQIAWSMSQRVLAEYAAKKGVL